MQFIIGSVESPQHQMSMNERVVVCDSTDAPINVMLPSVANGAGEIVIVRKQFGTNPVTVLSGDAMEWSDIVVGDSPVVLLSDGLRWIPLVDLGMEPVSIEEPSDEEESL